MYAVQTFLSVYVQETILMSYAIAQGLAQGSACIIHTMREEACKHVTNFKEVCNILQRLQDT